jgi:hypothetical protein
MKIPALMGFVAATLVIMSGLHLAGVLGDGSPPFDPDRAGIAEAVIAVVLAAGAIALARGGRGIALAALVFAIAGFGVGLSMTIRGHATWDIAYHATMLPLLFLGLLLLTAGSSRGRCRERGHRSGSRSGTPGPGPAT